MSEHRYVLEPYKGMNSRYLCPNCNKKTFVRYIDTETGQHIADHVGRCNREVNCGYHYTPKLYFTDNHILFNKIKPASIKPKAMIQQKQISFIPNDLFISSLKEYEKNNFVTYLINLFGIEVTNNLLKKYFIGTSKHWDGATIFWQIDINKKIRTGKIMLYNPATGKRVKEPFNYITWVHKLIKQPEFELKQCLFGEYLLNLPENKNMPIALVESEKTAVIASVYLPQFVWLAVGSLSNLSISKCEVLKSRRVSLFPDLNGFEKWNLKIKELSNIATFTISDLLERNATETERIQGLDLADYLIRYDYKEFIKPKEVVMPIQAPNNNLTIPKQQPNIYQNIINEYCKN